MTRVAFQGDLGAFSDEAVARFYGNAVERLPRRTFRDVVAAVESGVADRGVLPVENSIAGAVTESVTALAASSLLQAGDSIELPIRLHLLGLSRATLGDITRIASHPMALSQCRRFLGMLAHVKAVEWFDTAGAAREVFEIGDPSFAAVAGQAAADRYHLRVLVRDIHDRSDNTTRFVTIERRP